jgi:hypothetical protein
VKSRIALSFFGGLLLAVGLGLAWALHFPSTRANNIFFGGLLMPLAWVAAMLWLWFGSWKQSCTRLGAAGVALYTVVYLGFRFG